MAFHKHTHILIFACALVSACSGEIAQESTPGTSAAAPTPAAQYTKEGAFIVPEDWRRWVHVATTATPNGLNGGAAPFPGMHNTYIDPVAYDHWTRTGAFPEGTVMVKELVDFVEPDYPDESSDQIAGRGYYPRQPIGLGIAIKDSQRFADEPGGWAYFSVSATDGVVAGQSGPLQATANCNACHEASAGDTDFVFLEYYPNLRRSAPD